MADSQLEVAEATGEILVQCPSCAEAQSELAAANSHATQLETTQRGLEREIRSLSYKLQKALEDREAKAREHELFNTAADLFALWCAAAGEAEGRKKPKRSKFSGDRFWLVLPFIEKDSAEMCQRAIMGRTYDHFVAQRKNGSDRHFCEWSRIFASRDEFEDSCNRAPKDWAERVERLTA